MTGRPRFKPTKAQRNRVKLMKAAGWSNERIAAQIGVARNTLEKALAAELEFGADSKKLQVMENLEKASGKGNASASKQLLDMFDVASTLRPDGGDLPAPQPEREPRLGKKERLQREAENPDTTTEMGDLLARRAAMSNRIN